MNENIEENIKITAENIKAIINEDSLKIEDKKDLIFTALEIIKSDLDKI